jgi:DNA-binding transcriptional LysR family regulator
MTLAQLRTFATVARLGSVRAAAEALGVSEPAVSSAVAALRRELGDELFVRAGNGIAITPGGRRLAARAVEIVGLADQARQEVREARGERLLRVVATATVAEYAAPTLIAAFTRRVPGLEVALGVEPAEAAADLLADRRADVTLGPVPPGAAARGVNPVPFLRQQLVVVAGPRHPLASAPRPVPFAAAAREPWLAGPLGVEPGTTEARWLAHQRAWPREVRAFPSQAAALAAAAEGRGVALALVHAVRDDLRRGALVRLEVPGTPVVDLWHASTLGRDRLPPVVEAFRRFVLTPEATQAMLSGDGVAPARFRPSVYVTIWS